MVRESTETDLPHIVALLGQLYADPSHEDYAAAGAKYQSAYMDIASDPRQTLFVAEADGRIAGTPVLIVVPNLPRRGRRYAILENIVDAMRCGGASVSVKRSCGTRSSVRGTRAATR